MTGVGWSPSQGSQGERRVTPGTNSHSHTHTRLRTISSSQFPSTENLQPCCREAAERGPAPPCGHIVMMMIGTIIMSNEHLLTYTCFLSHFLLSQRDVPPPRPPSALVPPPLTATAQVRSRPAALAVTAAPSEGSIPVHSVSSHLQRRAASARTTR